MARLPVPGQDEDSWGGILNDYLTQSLNPDGTLKKSAVAASMSSMSMMDGDVPDATTTSKGIIQLAGDLSGTAAAPTVPALALLEVNAADPQFGNTRDLTQIQAAVDAVKAAGGGKIIIRKADGPWDIGRRVTGQQKLGGIYIDSSDITLEFDGTVLNLTGNCDFIKVQSTVGTAITITADTAITTSTLTVTDSGSFTVGQWVYVRLGQAAYDAAEPDWWLYAKIAAIPDGTSVTLDRPVGYAMSVAATTNVHQRSITPFTSLVENVAIRGAVNLVNTMTGGANAEGGIQVQFARNITIKDVTATNPGAGAVLLQFVDGATIGSVKSPKSAKQGGHGSKGRVLNLGECRNVIIDQVFAEDYEGAALLIEARCLGIFISRVLLSNTNAARDNAAIAQIVTLGNNHVSIDSITLLGKSSYFHDVGGTTGNELTLREAFFYTDAKPVLASLEIIRERLIINTVVFSKRRVWRRLIPLVPNMAGVQFSFPHGYLRRVTVYASTLTGLVSFYLGSSAATTANFVPQLVADSSANLAQGGGFGTGYNASNDTTKKCIIYTDSTVPSGAYLVVEIDYFVDPANITSSRINEAYPTTLPSLKVQGNVGFYGTTPIAKQTLVPGATDAATTQALANDIRAKLISLGLMS